MRLPVALSIQIQLPSEFDSGYVAVLWRMSGDGFWGRVGRANALAVHENDGRNAVLSKGLPFRVRFASVKVSAIVCRCFVLAL